MEHHRTSAYHPQSNGAVERFHRQLKAAIGCHADGSWTEVLPAVMLGIRATFKEDAQATAAEMVFGEALRLPGDLIEGDEHQELSQFVEQLRRRMKALQPVQRKDHGKKAIFVFKDLATTSHVFVRNDAVKKPLQPQYNGPYCVIQRGEKNFIVRIGDRNVNVSKERLKPAFILSNIENQVPVLTKEFKRKTVLFDETRNTYQ
ncbi:uncharacterized protein LOC123989209 [Osmia bicornis bicornis]|uniref:uncharacterized protein LOC123989209 n=1 Tax=Osmia bicornis bicornis TaxID=1437191 RepID=UPI001EAEDC8F|nr:uncharacterized protein LOC123989209 [Osmia bicornis bicornis]